VTFAAPIWLGAAVAVLLVGVLGLRVAEARRRRDLERFVAGPLLAALTVTSSSRRRGLKGGLLLCAMALGCVALAQPRFGWRWEETKRRGTDVLFAVDVSRSMLAADVNPDRLTRAKLAVIDLLRKLDGDRVGLVAFAGSAFLQSPLTLDHAAFQQTLESLDTDLIPRGGTDIGAALHEAEEAFRTAGKAQKLLVLVSDGEDLEGNALVAAREAAKQGITVYTVGVGTPAGDHISLSRAGGAGVVTDEHGQPVTSRLDEEGLRAVAEATGGFYVPLGAHGEGLQTIYDSVLSQAPKQEFSARSQRIPIERFQWPLGLALALAAGEALIRDRRRSRARAVAPRTLRAVAATASALAVVLMTTNALASPADAERAYAAGAYDEALGHYRAAAEAAPDDARLRFNEGAAAYRAGKHDEAAKAFQQALDSRDVTLQQRAYYDLGNAQFRLGEAAAKQSPAQAKASLEQAVKSYDGALALDPTDENAKFNRDVAKARLEALEQQQQQQNEQQQDQKQEQKQDQSQDQKQDSQQSQGGQQQKDPQQADSQKQDGQPQQGQGEQQQQGQSQPQEKPSQGAQGEDQKQEASQQQAQGSKSEQKDSQKQEGQGSTAQDEKSAGSQDQKQQNAANQASGSQGEPAPRRAEPQDQAAGNANRDANPERADGKEDGAATAAGSRVARPGEMSAEDAAQLLDSLRGDEQQAPRASARPGAAGRNDDEPIRNW
jgi:Ca-activated chloride channel family protein